MKASKKTDDIERKPIPFDDALRKILSAPPLKTKQKQKQQKKKTG